MSGARTVHADVPTLAEQSLPKPAATPAIVDPETLAPEWRTKLAVLCIAGRGPLDEAAATILALLRNKHGLSAEVVPHDSRCRGDASRAST